MDSLASRRGNSRSKNMLRHEIVADLGLGAAGRPEGTSSGLPDYPVGERPGRRKEFYRVRRHKIWLNHILRVLVFRLAPAADFNVHFARWRGVIPCKKRKHSSRFQMGY